jgi:hypothetical protein
MLCQLWASAANFFGPSGRRDLQLDGEGGQVGVFGKGGTTRAIQVPACAHRLAYAETGAGGPVFCSPQEKGGVLLPLTVLRIVRKSSARAGIELPSRLLVPAHTLSAAERTTTGSFTSCLAHGLAAFRDKCTKILRIPALPRCRTTFVLRLKMTDDKGRVQE